MKHCLVVLVLCLGLAGCDGPGTHNEKITVDGTTCIEARSTHGIAIDCDWPAH